MHYKKNILYLIVFLTTFIIPVDCLLAESAMSDSLKTFTISPFEAQYCVENDGKNPGKGNDGTQKDIFSKCLFSETVKRPTISPNFPLRGIDPYYLYGIWKGTITSSEKQSIKAYFDLSQADAVIYLNNNLVDRWRNAPKTLQLNLQKGDNTIRIEYHNHWHTTYFNVSFPDYIQLDEQGTQKLFNEIDFNQTKVVYLGAREANSYTPENDYNEIHVTIPGSSVPIFLFLNSYYAVNWVINNPQNSKLTGVALRGRANGSTVSMKKKPPVYELPASKDGYKRFSRIQQAIGKTPDYVFTKGNLHNIVIPDFFKGGNTNANTGKSNHPKSNDIKRAENYPVNAFVETLIIEQQNHQKTNTKIVKEPSFDGIFIEGVWKGYFDIETPVDKTFKIFFQGIKGELIIDGRSVWHEKGSDKEFYQHSFKPGRHEVMVVASPLEKSKPSRLNVSITDNARNLKYDELTSHLKKLGDFNSIYCGVRKSITADNSVKIRLRDSSKPVVLFLASYKEMAWDFQDCNTENIAAIVTSAKNSAETIKNLPSNIPIYHFFNLTNTTDIIPRHGKRTTIRTTFKKAVLQILSLTGKLPTGFSGARQTDFIAVPQIKLDQEFYQKIGFANVSKDYNVFIEYPKKIDAVFNPVTTKYIVSNSSSKYSRVKSIKPEIQRKSWAESLGVTKGIPTGAFKAYYFNIYNPGQPTFSGIVEDISINSTGAGSKNKYGIISENFGAFWIGNILLEKDKEMEINMDVSHAETRILIDNKEIKEQSIVLKKGLHTIEVEYVNDWHTYSFSFSLTEKRPLLTYEELNSQLNDLLPQKVHTAYVGVYESDNEDNSITLNIYDVGQPIFLILSSYSAINWKITGEGAKDVKALLISSLRSKSKIKGNVKQDTPRFYFPMWNATTYQWESKCSCQGRYHCSSQDLFDTIDYISLITGQEINCFSGIYSAKTFNIPGVVIDAHNLDSLKKVSQDNILEQARCEGPDSIPSYLNPEQVKQLGEYGSIQNALKIMEIIQRGTFAGFLQFIEPRKQTADQQQFKGLFLYLHNQFAGYTPFIADYLVDKKLYEKITDHKSKVSIPLVLKRKGHKDRYLSIRMKKVGKSWYFAGIDR